MKKNFEDIVGNILDNEILKIIISNVKSKNNYKYNKIVLELRKDKFYISQYTNNKVFNLNYNKQDIYEYIKEQQSYFKQFEFFTISNIYMVKISKKGKIFYSVSENKNNLKLEKEKNYILRQNTIIEPLIDMGIFNKDGKVIPKMYDKYKQINRFIEIIDDTIKNKNFKEINIIDFGCGKSYLTFIIYYYFNFIKKIKSNIIGLDLKEDVINKCNLIAKKYNYNNLRFELGDIAKYTPKFKPDMVITLHACDTATDYALYNAISWETKIILSVPCCQHEVNLQLKKDAFPLFSRYGIIKERMSAIFTDVIRCNLLEAMNYKVQLMEFIDFDNTPKNLMIRAIKAEIPKSKKIERITEVENLINKFRFKQTLYDLLKDEIKNIK